MKNFLSGNNNFTKQKIYMNIYGYISYIIIHIYIYLYIFLYKTFFIGNLLIII